MIDKKNNTEFGILLSLVLVMVSSYFRIQLPFYILTALLITLLLPQLYTPFTWLWFRLGESLSFVVTRCILFLLFFLIITPISLLRRLAGKDPFHLRQFGKSGGSTFIVLEKTYRDTDLNKQY